MVGIPISGIILLLVTAVFSWQKRLQKPQLAMMTLIPQTIGGKSLNFSIRLTREDVTSALDDIKTFLKDYQVAETTIFRVRLCCEELLYNMTDYAVEKYAEKHFADIHILLTDPQVSVLLKDDGRPFNPIFKNRELRRRILIQIMNTWACCWLQAKAPRSTINTCTTRIWSS